MRLWLAAVMLLAASAVVAEPLRIATFNASLTRRGPGVLLKDIVEGKDKQIIAVAQIIKAVRPDILLLNELDHDYENLALKAFLKLLATDDGAYAGITYPYSFAPPQNTGVPSGLDLNGDGKLGGPADAFGFGKFRGQYAMALISRYPIDVDAVQSFTDLLWKDVPGARLPTYPDGRAFPSEKVQKIMRFSSKGHWIVPVQLLDGRILQVMASHPTPPVFDGPEDANGKRNADEILFWDRYLRGTEFVDQPFVILGDLNADPMDGDGNHAAITQLLNNPLLQDPRPTSKGGEAAARQGYANLTQRGDPVLDTTYWRDDPGPGNLRVDYVLPSVGLKVLGAGVFWPVKGQAGFELIGSGGHASSDHRLVWVDIE